MGASVAASVAGHSRDAAQKLTGLKVALLQF